MGPCDGFEHKSFRAAVGKLDLIGKGYDILIAGQCDRLGQHLSPLTVHHEGPYGSLVQQPMLYLMGRCMLIV